MQVRFVIPIAMGCVLVHGWLSSSMPVAGEEQTIRFRKQLLMVSPNEGCAIADVDRDGKLDLIAGTHWFAGPGFAPRPLRDIDEFENDYLRNNGDHAWDVNGDGWLDVVSGDFLGDKIFWYENPRAEALKKGLKWQSHLLAVTRGENEGTFLRDIDGDGQPEIVINCWIDDAPMVAWKLVNGEDGRPGLERVEIGRRGNGHGIAFGDVNGDGREDILCKVGWYERPPERALEHAWTLHRDWSLGAGSVPFVSTDVNRDGRHDLVWGLGHDFGLFWYEQLAPSADGKTRWQEHLIDRSYSQTHCLHLADLDGDGQQELITGKRVRGHPVGDPGVNEPECLYYYTWDGNPPKFTRHTISDGEGVGTGMQIRTADLDEDGRADIAVGGKSGTWVLLNLGP